MQLVKIRASPINGCANCLQMHAADVRKAGESEKRIYLPRAWGEALLHKPRERAAPAWTEALTLLPRASVPDAHDGLVKAVFTPREQVDLMLAISAINSWNRLAVGFRAVHPNDRKGAALKTA